MTKKEPCEQHSYKSYFVFNSIDRITATYYSKNLICVMLNPDYLIDIYHAIIFDSFIAIHNAPATSTDKPRPWRKRCHLDSSFSTSTRSTVLR